MNFYASLYVKLIEWNVFEPLQKSLKLTYLLPHKIISRKQNFNEQLKNKEFAASDPWHDPIENKTNEYIYIKYYTWMILINFFNKTVAVTWSLI
jgi:hypothetical protein